MKWLLIGLVFAESQILQQAEKLRDSLPLKDPARQTMTLRLADMYFDEATKTDASDSVRRYQQKALHLYQTALSGHDGLFTVPAGRLKMKIHFQMARLHTELGSADSAIPLWKELVAQGELLDLKREAALHLAEWHEKESRPLEAAKLYGTALELAPPGDVASYAHYRRAWIWHQNGKHPQALAEVRQSLWDGKGQIKEEALRDFILFLAASPTPAHEAISEIEELADKTSNPKLINRLAEAYLSAGNKKAGILALGQVVEKNPESKDQIRLLEEYYGIRNWGGFRDVLAQLQRTFAKSVSEEDEKTLRRLTVQLDAERLTNPETAADFQQTVSLYLTFFPKNADRMKMMRGWLAAEKSSDRKMAQIVTWMESGEWKKEDLITLREARAEIAQKEKRFDVVADEMKELIALGSDPKKQRNHAFVRATALIELGKQSEGVEILEGLASDNTKDSVGLKSAQLTSEAEFEAAVKLGNSREALSAFTRFCHAKKFLPKSCDNAKVLAVKLKDSDSLITVLKTTGKGNELANEYEANGHFKEAAELLEKSLKDQVKDYLKVALLFEMGDEKERRDRILYRMIAVLRSRPLGKEEDAIYLTLKEANLLSRETLSLKWTKNRCTHLELVAVSTPGVGRELASCPISTGPAWDEMALAQVEKLDASQRNIRFHGKNNRVLFSRRVTALNQLKQVGEKYYKTASPAAAARIAERLASAYSDLAMEIQTTPVPNANLSDEDRARFEASLAQGAEPFKQKADSYLALSSEKPQERTEESYSPDFGKIRKALEAIRQSPYDESRWTDAKETCEEQQFKRCAYYLAGRVAQLSKKEAS